MTGYVRHDYVKDLTLFDRLPASVRRVLRESPLNISVPQMLELEMVQQKMQELPVEEFAQWLDDLLQKQARRKLNNV